MDMPEIVMDKTQEGCWWFTVEGSSGYLQDKAAVLFIALQEKAIPLSLVTRWNLQLAGECLPINCAILLGNGEWWLAQKFNQAGENITQQVRLQINLVNIMASQVRQLCAENGSGWAVI